MVDWPNTQVPKLKEILTETIIKEMKKLNISQGKLADIVGMDRRNMNKTLRGTERGISFDQLIRIANGLGLEISLKIQRKK